MEAVKPDAIFPSAYSASGGRAHACNCIGCCRICGQCRTTPWHARTCAKVAAFRRELAAEIARG